MQVPIATTVALRLAAVALALLVVAGCASREVLLELQASVLYEKPEIRAVDYGVQDSRRDGGTVVISVQVQGDPGLAATFDISPGITDREPMAEGPDGRYSGEFSLPPDLTGGPYTIIGRLTHEKAGEVVLRDPNPLTISLFR